MSSADLPYYDFGKILSYNAVYNFVCGARGLGKTYGAKKYVINNAIRSGEQFIYLRRFKTELKTRASFFADIAHEFPGYEFRVNGSSAQMKLEGDHEKWTTVGYFLSLSTSQSVKSVPYPDVTTIIYDEFIIDRGTSHYLSGEADLFNDFYSTVDRYQDRTIVLFLSNAVSIMNPYFIEYDIEPTHEIVRKADGFMVANFPDSESFGKAVRRTRFGKFITENHGEYAEYAIDNDFKDDDGAFITRKSGRAGYVATIRTTRGTFSVWTDSPSWFIQAKRPKSEICYALDVPDLREGEVMLGYSDKLTQYLRAAFRQGRVFFDAPRSRNTFRELFVR